MPPWTITNKHRRGLAVSLGLGLFLAAVMLLAAGALLDGAPAQAQSSPTATPAIVTVAPQSPGENSSQLAAFAERGSYPVSSAELTWQDSTRGRAVPVKIYYPATAPAPWPVIIFSHGLGGSREGYRWLAMQWASHGYCVALPTHAGSDSSLLRGAQPLRAMRAAMSEPANLVNRPLDIRFVIDQLAALNSAPGPFSGKLDMTRIGAGGHSFGGYTTLASAGTAYDALPGAAGKLAEPRLKAALAMSPPARPRNAATLDALYGPVKIPFMEMTGTQDRVPMGGDTPENRRIPFDHMRGNERYLLTLNGGDHMIFAGLGAANTTPDSSARAASPAGGRRGGLLERLRERKREQTEQGADKDAMRRAILGVSTAFWDACLKDDSTARQWLQNGCKIELDGVAGFEFAL